MNVGGGASTLAFTQQPVNTAAGSAMNATVKLTDGAGNPLAGVSVTLTVPDNSAALIGATSGAGTLSGTVVQTTDNSGTAIFGELSIDLAGTKQLRAIAEQYAPVISNSFQVTPGSAATVAVISGSPQATVASQLLPSLLQVKVTDAKGNPQAARRLRLHFRLPDLAGSFPALPPCLRMPTACYRTPVDRKQHPGNFTVTATAQGAAAKCDLQPYCAAECNRHVAGAACSDHFRKRDRSAGADFPDRTDCELRWTHRALDVQLEGLALSLANQAMILRRIRGQAGEARRLASEALTTAQRLANQQFVTQVQLIRDSISADDAPAPCRQVRVWLGALLITALPSTYSARHRARDAAISSGGTLAPEAFF
jgi:hypothetical protein